MVKAILFMSGIVLGFFLGLIFWKLLSRIRKVGDVWIEDDYMADLVFDTHEAFDYCRSAKWVIFRIRKKN